MATALNMKVNNALYAVDQFSSLLEMETDALHTSNFNLFESLQDKKFELAQHYQDAILAFEEDFDALPDLDDASKTKLRAAHARFAEAAAGNQQALEVKQKISDRILNLIMTAAKQTVMDTPSYSNKGYQDLSSKIPVHFKLNERV